MRKMGRRSKRKYTVLLRLIIISIIILSMLFLIEVNLIPTVKSVAEAKANLVATDVINTVIYKEVLYDKGYNDLITIHKDSQDRITLVQANSIAISRLISEASLKIKERLNALEGEAFEIPLGQALGSYLFAAYGPGIKVRMFPVGEVETSLFQDFSEAGINQTRHILYLNIQASIKIVVPMATEKIPVKTQMPIAETIIVGTVPETVVDIDGLGNLEGSLFKGIKQVP